MPAGDEAGPPDTAAVPRPAPDPVKLLEQWMEWERGQTPPGRVISNLKTGGLRDLLEKLAAESAGAGG